MDSAFFGTERTGGTALSQLAGELHGASTELEAALALLTAHAYRQCACRQSSLPQHINCCSGLQQQSQSQTPPEPEPEPEPESSANEAFVAREAVVLLAVSVRALWQHASTRTPRERALGWGAVALNVVVPNGGGGSETGGAGTFAG